jgi:PTH1 family peptidyl-tRNA hydrolase
VVGLGNPGPAYAGTRHNVGYVVVDVLAEDHGIRLARHKRAHAESGEGRFTVPGEHVVLAEPLSFMNESGGPVKALMAFYGTTPDRLIVVHDELDLPLGTVRVKLGGGDNGHNGLRSLRRALGTGDFLRVRVGIGRPPGRQDPADFVLAPFRAAERDQVPVDRAADAVRSLVLEGLEPTQNRIHAEP